MIEETPLTHSIHRNWIQINCDDSFTVELRQWMEENMNHNWSLAAYSGWISCYIYFEDESDAMAFKLTFG